VTTAAGSTAALDAGVGADLLVSGEAVEVEVRVARIGSRALALLIDIAVEIAVFLMLMVGAAVVLAAASEIADQALVAAVATASLVVAFVGYPTAMETLFNGRTLGKLALGLRVVRVDGGPIRFRHALTRTLVSVTLEWPGLLLAPLTWAISLSVMLAQPQGRRIGDLAAGTLVIHDRAPESWGWAPVMPPHLASWARLLDLTGLSDDLALAVRHYLARNRAIREPARGRLGHALAREVAACTTPPPPRQVPGWAYLAAVLAERHRRAAFRMAASRQLSSAVWAAVRPPDPTDPPRRKKRRKRAEPAPQPAALEPKTAATRP
jgi:uncharacterized RDD family membrane protein YckC